MGSRSNPTAWWCYRMKLKTFRGPTMAEALAQVKRQFGRDAVILSTRSVARSRLLGMGEKPYVEITAAKQMSDLPDGLRADTVPRRVGRIDRADGAATVVSPTATQTDPPPVDALVSEVGALKSLVHDLVRRTRSADAALGELPSALYETYLDLVKGTVAEDMAQTLVNDLRRDMTDEELLDPASLRQRLVGAVESMLPTAGPIRLVSKEGPTLVALVGPTGVGKTTTIAKLAANFSLREHRKVGLITIDTYRIAAVEQLRTYADLIDVPFHVVMSPSELRDAVDRMSDRDVVFIDTAGRSQRDTAKIQELQACFDVVRPDEIHLVLSSTCGEAVLVEAIERFAGIGVDRVIFTKLDEAIGFGVMLGCLQKANARLSYVTTGQDVPDDIRLGQGKVLARLILGERSSPEPAVAQTQ